MVSVEPAEAVTDAGAYIAMCLDCEWSSAECRNAEQATVRAKYHNWRYHGAPKP